MGKANGNGKPKSVKPKSDRAARKYEPRRVTETGKRNGKQKRA